MFDDDERDALAEELAEALGLTPDEARDEAEAQLAGLAAVVTTYQRRRWLTLFDLALASFGARLRLS
jgi:hypothetical protein